MAATEQAYKFVCACVRVCVLWHACICVASIAVLLYTYIGCCQIIFEGFTECASSGNSMYKHR